MKLDRDYLERRRCEWLERAEAATHGALAEARPSQAAAQMAAVDGLRDVLSTEIRQGRFSAASFIDVTNEKGDSLIKVRFSDAVRIDSGS